MILKIRMNIYYWFVISFFTIELYSGGDSFQIGLTINYPLFIKESQSLSLVLFADTFRILPKQITQRSHKIQIRLFCMENDSQQLGPSYCQWLQPRQFLDKMIFLTQLIVFCLLSHNKQQQNPTFSLFGNLFEINWFFIIEQRYLYTQYTPPISSNLKIFPYYHMKQDIILLFILLMALLVHSQDTGSIFEPPKNIDLTTSAVIDTSHTHAPAYENQTQKIEQAVNIEISSEEELSTRLMRLKENFTPAPTFDHRMVSSNDPPSTASSTLKGTNSQSDPISSLDSQRIIECNERMIMGLLWQQIVTNNSCISLPLLWEYNRTIDLYIFKRSLGQFTYEVLICGNPLLNAVKLKSLLITPSMIEQYCRSGNNNKDIRIIWTAVTKEIKGDLSANVKISAQYLKDEIILFEEMSFNSIVKVQEKLVGKFLYKFQKGKDIRVFLSQIRGRFKVYAKLVKSNQIDKNILSDIKDHFSPNKNQTSNTQQLIVSIDKKYFYYPQISQISQISGSQCVLRTQLFASKDKSCGDCKYILIVVFSEERMGEQVQFRIQVFQQLYNFYLRSGFSKNSFYESVQSKLDEGQIGYYFFTYGYNSYSTLILQTSSLKQKCANISIAALEGDGNYLVNTVSSGQSIIRDYERQKIYYYLSVKAIEFCSFTIQMNYFDVFSMTSKRKSIINLKQGTANYFLVNKQINKHFKIISLNKYGKINFYINQSIQIISKEVINNLDFNKFTYKSKHPNVLAIDTKDPQLCDSCLYLVGMEAVQNTRAFLHVVYPQTIITLSKGYSLSDYLAKKEDFTLAVYKSVENTQVNVKVYSGALNITVSSQQNKFTQSFQSKEGVLTFIIDIKSISELAKNKIPEATEPQQTKSTKFIPFIIDTKSISELAKNKIPEATEPQQTKSTKLIPINFVISAVTDKVLYTIEVKSLDSNSISQLTSKISLKQDESTQFQITNTKPVLFSGFLDDVNGSLILSANSDYVELFQYLQMDAKVDGENVQVVKFNSNNFVSITFKKEGEDSNESNNNTRIFYQLYIKFTDSAYNFKPKKVKQNSLIQVQYEYQDQTILKGFLTPVNSTVKIMPRGKIVGEGFYLIPHDDNFLLEQYYCSNGQQLKFGSFLKDERKRKQIRIEQGYINLYYLEKRIYNNLNRDRQNNYYHGIVKMLNSFVQVKQGFVRWVPTYIQYEFNSYNHNAQGQFRFSHNFFRDGITLEYKPIDQLSVLYLSKYHIKNVSYYLYVSNTTELLPFPNPCPISSPNVLVIQLNSPKQSQTALSDFVSNQINEQVIQKYFPSSKRVYLNVFCDVSVSLASTQYPQADKYFRFFYSEQHRQLQNDFERFFNHHTMFFFFCIALIVVGIYLCGWKIYKKLDNCRKNKQLNDTEKKQMNNQDVSAVSEKQRAIEDSIVEG